MKLFDNIAFSKTVDNSFSDFIINEMNFSVIALDHCFKIRYCNSTFRSLFIQNGNSIIENGMPIRDLLTEESFHLLTRKIPLLDNGIEEPFDIEISFNHKFYQFQVTPKGIFENGELNGSFFIMKNITGQAQINSSLSISDDILEQIGSIVIVGDCNGNILYCSPSVNQILGYDTAKILNNGWWHHTFIDEDDAQNHKQFLGQLIQDGHTQERAPYERKVICRDGSHKWLLCKDTRGPVGLFITAAHDISDLKKAHESLEISQKDLAEKNKELDTFVYKASHDLKGPLASIIGLCNIYQKEYEKAPGNEIMDMIFKSTTKLDHILNDLLRVSRMHHSEIKWEDIHLQELCSEIINQLQYASNKNILLNLNPETYFLNSDRALIYSIFQNLISNSIKYHLPNKDQIEINIDIVDTPNEIKIHYQDNGMGVKKEMCDSLFEMFFRAHEDNKGTGLGLYIVKQSIKKLGGSIHCESNLNEGIHFYITLKK